MTRNLLLMLLLGTGLAVPLAGCERNNSVEEAVEETGDEIKDAADEVKDEVDDATSG